MTLSTLHLVVNWPVFTILCVYALYKSTIDIDIDIERRRRENGALVVIMVQFSFRLWLSDSVD